MFILSIVEDTCSICHEKKKVLAFPKLGFTCKKCVDNAFAKNASLLSDRDLSIKTYRHYKGGLYSYIGETTARSGNEEISHEFKARYSEKPTTFITIGKVRNTNKPTYVTRWPEPLVIYRDAHGDIWARPADMFHGYIEDGRKRFVEVPAWEIASAEPQA